MHLFGSVCSPLIQDPKKLYPRCKKRYFVGYDYESPSYLIYHPEKELFQSIDLLNSQKKFDNQPEPDLLLSSIEPTISPEVKAETPNSPKQEPTY